VRRGNDIEDLIPHHPLIGIIRFLLVSLNIDAILQGSTIHRRREGLGRMTHGLRDAYDATIERIKAQGGDKSKLGMEALLWVSHAERPLKADELCHALAVELGSTDFNGANVPSMSTLVSCCQGLITVDKGASTVRLAHLTLQEYLSAGAGILSTPHSSIAETCLTYLNSEQVKAIPADSYPDFPEIPFLRYSSLYWGVHAKKELSDCTRSLALELFQGYESYEGHVSTYFLLGLVVDLSPGDPEQEDHLSPEDPEQEEDLDLSDPDGDLDLADSDQGDPYLADFDQDDPDFEDFSQEEDIDVEDCDQEEDLDWEDSDQEESLSFEDSDQGEGPDPEDSGQYEDMYIDFEDDDEVLEEAMALEDSRARLGFTGLHCASFFGIVEVVVDLLEMGCYDINKEDFGGYTPLARAVWNGQEDVVKILLGRKEVHPDKPDRNCTTPLSHAASRGNEEVVKALLRREGVNPDNPDKSGQTPLSRAAECGHEQVVKILLGQEKVNPDKPGRDGRTPLAHAAWNGHKGVVKMLLGREEVNPDSPDKWGKTPLSLAAKCGHEHVVEILLGQRKVNPDKADRNGRTPLLFAAMDGHKGVVKMLLGQEKINPDKPG